MSHVIQYARREDANFFTDFAGNQKREDMGERMWYYDTTFMDPQLCDEVVAEVRRENPQFLKGTGLYIPEGGDKTYRDSDVYFMSNMENPIYREARDNIVATTVRHNNHFWNFNLTHLMNIQYTQYNENKQHFNWHGDGPLGIDPRVSLPPNLVFRKLTTVVCLADHTEYDGGEFLLFDCTVEPQYAICSFKMTKGEAIIFPAFMLHKVCPVTKGLRISLVNWFCGPRWQ